MNTRENLTENSPMDTTDGSGDAVAGTTGANNGDSNAVATAVAVSSSVVSSSAATAMTFSANSQATAQIFTTPTATPLASGPISVSMPNVAQQPIQVQVQGPTAYLQSHPGYYYQNANPMLCASYITPQLGSVQPLQLQLHSGGGISHMATAVSSPAKVATSSVAKTSVSGNTYTPTSVATTMAQFASSQFKNVAPALGRPVQPYPPNTLIQLNHPFIPAVQPATSSAQAIAAKTIAIDKKQNCSIVSTLQPKPAAIVPNVTSQTSILRPMPAQIIAQNISPNSPFPITQFQPTFQTLQSNNWLGALSSNPSLAILRPTEQPSIQYALHASPQLQTISVHGAPLQIAPSSSLQAGHLPPTMVSAMAAPAAISTSATVTANVTGSSSHSQNINTPPSVPKLKPLAARPASTTSTSLNTSSSVTTVANPNSSSTPNKSTNVTPSNTSGVAFDSSSKSTASSTNLLRSTKTLSQTIKIANNSKQEQASSQLQISEQNINDHKHQSTNANPVKSINSNSNVAPGNKVNVVNKISSESTMAPGLGMKGNSQTSKSTPGGIGDVKGNKEIQRTSNDLRGTKRPTERREVSANATSAMPHRDVVLRNGINKNKTLSPMQVASKKNEPSVLVHVIENYVIEESTHPFPVSESSSDPLVKENGTHKESDHSHLKNNNSSNVIATPVQTQPRSEQIATPNGTKLKPVECSNCGPKNTSRSRSGIRSRSLTKLCTTCSAKKTNGTEKTFNPVVGNLSEYDFNSSNDADQSTRNESPVAVQPEAKKAKMAPKKINSTAINESRALSLENAAINAGSKSSSQANGTVNKMVEDVFIPPSGKDPHKWKVQDVYDFVRHLPGCEEYADEFRSQEIDGQALLLLEEKHLMSAMSMKLGPALKICSRIRELQADTNNTSR